MVYRAAIHAGLTEVEAQDAVQETFIKVMKALPKFDYDPAIGSFRSWLWKITAGRIASQFRHRLNTIKDNDAQGDEDSPADFLEAIPDPAGSELEALWNREWEANLMEAALRRLRIRTDALDYQIFDLYVFQEWPASEVGKFMRLSRGRVYLAKFRVARRLKKELKFLHRVEELISRGGPIAKQIRKMAV